MAHKILVGKSYKEIIDAFRQSKRIDEYDWNEFIKKLNEVKRKNLIVVVWTVPLMILGVAFIITILASFSDHSFPLVFHGEKLMMLKKFINILWGMIIILIPLFITIFPFIVLGRTYKWFE